MQIKLEHLTKRFGDTIAVNDLSITLESGRLIALLGPSGCGKTTTLNMISGILPVSGGSIFFDDRDVTNLPPEKRGIGLVFQNYALYPHSKSLRELRAELQDSASASVFRPAVSAELLPCQHVSVVFEPDGKIGIPRIVFLCGEQLGDILVKLFVDLRRCRLCEIIDPL